VPFPEVSDPPKKRARDLLLQAAARLFYAQGVGATGIDAITAAAGVAKKSLYNNFSSKSDLVAAYLSERHEEWLGLYRARVANTAGPRDRVLAVFDAYLDHANMAYEHGFRGCGLLNAAAELPAGSPGRLAVQRHKEEVEALLARHLAELLPGQEERSARLAGHFAFVLEGAMVRAGLEGGDSRLLEGRRIAAEMLEEL
jgi:AcrR family transcriptional regulator